MLKDLTVRVDEGQCLSLLRRDCEGKICSPQARAE